MKNKFGIEIEINSFDNRDFISNPLRKGEIPNGINEVSKIISDAGSEVEIQPWGYNHDNIKWVCKPDSSCGIEICSPVFNLKNCEQIFLVINNLFKDNRIKIDDRCSFHVHADVSPIDNIYESKLLTSVLAWWVKSEHIFMDFAVPNRKKNQFCKFIGKTDLFDHEENVSCFRLVSKLSNKYYTLNTFHLLSKRRQTIEFRLGEGTKDLVFVKNWLSIINHFLKTCSESSPPDNYKWLDYFEFFNFINFPSEIKKWFLQRLISNCDFTSDLGQYARMQYEKILDKM